MLLAPVRRPAAWGRYVKAHLAQYGEREGRSTSFILLLFCSFVLLFFLFSVFALFFFFFVFVFQGINIKKADMYLLYGREVLVVERSPWPWSASSSLIEDMVFNFFTGCRGSHF